MKATTIVILTEKEVREALLDSFVDFFQDKKNIKELLSIGRGALMEMIPDIANMSVSALADKFLELDLADKVLPKSFEKGTTVVMFDKTGSNFHILSDTTKI